MIAAGTDPARGHAPALVHAIGLPRATAMVIGTIIGASIFVQPSLVSGAVPSAGGVLLVWAVSGFLTLIGALVCAELASAFPRTGGVYVFLREAYSPAVAYVWGWAMFWVMHSGIIAAIAMVFARYVGHFMVLGDVGTRLTGAGAILVLSAVNYVGVRHGSALQTFFTAIKLFAITAIVVLGIAWVIAHGSPTLSPIASHQTPGTGQIGSFITATMAGLFAYGGWHMVTYAAEETHDAVRTIPRALFIGTAIVTVAYIAVNAAYLAVLPIETVTASPRVAADFADAVIGSGGGSALSALVICSTLGAMTGILLAGPRVYLAMAQDGLLFAWAGAVHPRYRTPHVAIVMQGVWSAVLVLTGSYRVLFTRVVYTEWIFFALMAAGLFVLRRRPGYAPAYRAWGYPILPAIFVVSSAAIVAHQVATEPAESLSGLAIVAAGLPVYWLWTRRRTHSNRSEP
jgi:APA family basic amino acid/polyamine antiporter